MFHHLKSLFTKLFGQTHQKNILLVKKSSEICNHNTIFAIKMKFTIRIILVIAVLFFAADFFAQPGGSPPGGPGSNPPCWPPPCVPIDGGISFLIALGAAYGGKKAFDKFKNQE